MLVFRKDLPCIIYVVVYGLFLSADLRLGFIDELYFIELGLRAIETNFLHSTPTTPTSSKYIYL